MKRKAHARRKKAANHTLIVTFTRKTISSSVESKIVIDSKRKADMVKSQRSRRKADMVLKIR